MKNFACNRIVTKNIKLKYHSVQSIPLNYFENNSESNSYTSFRLYKPAAALSYYFKYFVCAAYFQLEFLWIYIKFNWNVNFFKEIEIELKKKKKNKIKKSALEHCNM